VSEDTRQHRHDRGRPVSVLREVARTRVLELPVPRRLLGDRGPRVVGVMSDVPPELLERWLEAADA
jgi:hypothetical protein